MNHPGVVVLFDFARVTPEAADASDGRLVAGSPYVVMELAVAAGLGAMRDFDAAAAWFLGPRTRRAIVRPEHPIVADWAARRWDTVDSERAELARRA